MAVSLKDISEKTHINICSVSQVLNHHPRAMKLREETREKILAECPNLPAHKLHCSVLAEEAIKSALKDYYEKNNLPYDKKQFPDCENCAHCHD